MAKPYIVTINNGTGTTNVVEDTYTVTANVNGYDNSTINPTSLTYDGSTNTYNFTISATGTLTLHVTETGTSSGTPVVGATFIRTDSTGNTTYGTEITTDSSGNAQFANVPFGTDAPTIYYKQTASDGSHSFDETVKSITLTTSTQTEEIQNEGEQPITVNLTDSNYANLPIDDGTITLS